MRQSQINMVRRALIRRGVDMRKTQGMRPSTMRALARRTRGRTAYVRPSGMGDYQYGYRAPIRAVPSIITGRTFTPPPMRTGLQGIGCAGTMGCDSGCAGCSGSGGLGFWQAIIGGAMQAGTGILQARETGKIQRTDIKAQRDISLAQIRSGNVATRQESKSQRTMMIAGGALLAVVVVVVMKKKR